MEDQRGGLVGFQGTGNGEPGLRVPVEDVDQLLLLDGTNHHGSALGIDGQVLPGHDPPTSRLAERLHVDAVEGVLGAIVLQDHDPTRIRPQNDVVWNKRSIC